MVALKVITLALALFFGGASLINTITGDKAIERFFCLLQTVSYMLAVYFMYF